MRYKYDLLSDTHYMYVNHERDIVILFEYESERE